jgi:hypothetical protein
MLSSLIFIIIKYIIIKIYVYSNSTKVALSSDVIGIQQVVSSP